VAESDKVPRPAAVIETVEKPPPEQVATSEPVPPSLVLQPAVSAPPVEVAVLMSVAPAGAAKAIAPRAVEAISRRFIPFPFR
jgi:hypothetical protein